MLIAPVAFRFPVSKGVREFRNPVMAFLKTLYVTPCGGDPTPLLRPWESDLGDMHRVISSFSGIIGSEFLPHLDEGAI